jgi:hypothetical protein
VDSDLDPELDELLTEAARKYVSHFGLNAADAALAHVCASAERGDTEYNIKLAKLTLGRLLELQPADTKQN